MAFSPAVCKKIKYYVYRLVDPRNGETFYVGKGKDNRVFHHVQAQLKAEDCDELSDKLKTIREIRAAGLEVIHVIHRHGMTEDVAFEVEAALIDAYPGAATLVTGHGSNDYGVMNAAEIIRKYECPEVLFEHRVVMININKTITARSIYDAVRFCWRINVERARQAEYVLAVSSGIVVGAFDNIEWKQSTVQNFPEYNDDVPQRWGFTGKDAPVSIQQLYVGKRVPDTYRAKGAISPIRYSWQD